MSKDRSARLEEEKRQVIYVFGVLFRCYGNPWKGCEESQRYKAGLEPCVSCINKYGQHLRGEKKNE